MAFHPPRFFLGLVCSDSEAALGRFLRVGSIFTDEMHLPSDQEGVLSWSWVPNIFSLFLTCLVVMAQIDAYQNVLYLCVITRFWWVKLLRNKTLIYMQKTRICPNGVVGATLHMVLNFNKSILRKTTFLYNYLPSLAPPIFMILHVYI